MYEQEFPNIAELQKVHLFIRPLPITHTHKPAHKYYIFYKQYMYNVLMCRFVYNI